MQPRRAFWGVILSTILISGGGWTLAVDGRDFAGFYELTNVVEDPHLVTFTFTERTFNYSGEDVAEATIILENSLFLDEYAAFLDVWIPDQGAIRLQGDLIIPREEYDFWQQGASPSLVVEFQDGDGNWRRQGIELVQMLVGEEGYDGWD